ncbi:MAG: hypothetical protein ACFB16_03915 [Phormidesmis sp.]
MNNVRFLSKLWLMTLFVLPGSTIAIAQDVTAPTGGAETESPTIDLQDLDSSDPVPPATENPAEVVVGANEEQTSYDGVAENRLFITAVGAVAYVDLFEASSASVESGNISHAYLYDTSDITISGSAEISHLTLSGNATGSLSASNVGHLTLIESSTFEISESAEVSHLTLEDSTQGQINGGTFSFIRLQDNSEAHIRSATLDGGSFVALDANVSGGAITFEPGTKLNIYAQTLSFDNGQLSGTWADGRDFQFAIVQDLGNEEEGPIFEVPDAMPAAVVFHETTTAQ